MPRRFSFEMWGEDFWPSRVPFQFTEQHDPGSMETEGRLEGEVRNYGSASYVAPSCIDNPYGISHVVDTIEPILGAIRAAGATSCHLSIVRHYYAQCNEDYGLEEVQMMARLGCGFDYSAHSVTEEEEAEMERKNAVEMIELCGIRICGLLASEFWLDGALADPFSTVFLTTDGPPVPAWAVYFDDEDGSWKIKTTVNVPEAGTAEGDNHIRYSITDLSASYPARGRIVRSFVERDTGDRAEARLGFEGGGALVFAYHYGTGRGSLTLEAEV